MNLRSRSVTKGQSHFWGHFANASCEEAEYKRLFPFVTAFILNVLINYRLLQVGTCRYYRTLNDYIKRPVSGILLDPDSRLPTPYSLLPQTRIIQLLHKKLFQRRTI
ncbi:hypothetical protein [Moorena sp. SIOASIH]|uniref:hypothetical protein n=1 Tax=Moorena sp. SIOASIH TaxID=2607817 RepID=UPI0025DB6DD3|nr:hypothetical protein [Moorena sp. SIOASIH]